VFAILGLARFGAAMLEAEHRMRMLSSNKAAARYAFGARDRRVRFTVVNAHDYRKTSQNQP